MMEKTDYRKYLERTSRELMGEPEPRSDFDTWGDRLLIAVVVLWVVFIVVRTLMG